jgi:tetratricopeptide (TPR) repeat protein
VKKFIVIATMIGLAIYAYSMFVDKKSATVANKGETNIFANVDFSQLLPSNRLEDQAKSNPPKEATLKSQPPVNNKNTIAPPPPKAPIHSSSPSTANYQTPKYASINVQNLGQMVAPDSTASLLGQMLAQSQNPIKLIELKTQIETLYPKPEKGDIKLARALNQQGLAAFSQENFTNAASLFLDAARANPADIEVLNNYAYALLKSGNNQLAQQVLGYVLSLAPGRTSAWANLGEIYANLNRIDASAASLVVGFQFSGNKEKTLEFFNKTSQSTSNNALKSAITKALSQLSSY